MSLVLGHFIGNASSGSATSVQEKENEIQQQCRLVAKTKFSHQEPEKAVLVENHFFNRYNIRIFTTAV